MWAELGHRWVLDDEILAELSVPTAADDVLVAASAHRAACLDLASRSTTALLAAVGWHESHLGCARASGGCWGSPRDRGHRHTAHCRQPVQWQALVSIGAPVRRS